MRRAARYGDTDPLAKALFRDGLHPRAADVLSRLVELAVDEHTDDPSELLLTALEIAEALPAPADVLRTHVDLLLAILPTDPEAGDYAAGLLGRCAPDTEVAARLRQTVDTATVAPGARDAAMAAAALLDPQGSTPWLLDRLTGADGVGALDAMRIISLPPPPSAASVLTQAFRAREWIFPLEELLAYVGDPAVYAAAARSAYAVHRADAARAMGALRRDGALSAELEDLLVSLLDDEDTGVQRRAYKVVIFDEALARRMANRLAEDLAARHKSRPGAMHALIGIGDPRWQPYAAEALREGWAPPSLLDALREADLPWSQISDAVLARIGALTSTDYRGSLTRRLDDLRKLAALVLDTDDADAEAELQRLLRGTTDVVRVLLARSLPAPDPGERADHEPRSAP